jgi:hypothetical protein
MKNTLIVNFLGGAGAGKSTQASGLFYKLKTAGYDCELINEYAKTCTWEKNWTALNNQFLVSAQQNYKQDMLLGQVDAVITDSPILLGLMYYNETDESVRKPFTELLINLFKRNNNIVFYIERQKKYNPNGRNQTEEEARAIDVKVLELLKNNGINYISIPGNPSGLDDLFTIVKGELEKEHAKSKLSKGTDPLVP